MRYTYTQLGRMTHICADDLTIIGSGHGHYLKQCWHTVNSSIKNNTQWIFSEIYTFSLKKYISKCRLQNGGHFVSASVYQLE